MPTAQQSQSHIITDHDTIRKWVEERKGVPAVITSTRKNNETGILRIMFPERGKNPSLTEISWDEFFRKFDEERLKFLYQEKTQDGNLSRFFKFVRAGRT